MSATDEWFFDVVDPDIELPGWILVPGPGEDQEEWLTSSTELLEGMTSFDGREMTPETIRRNLLEALEVRSSSPALAVLQVWPTWRDATALCFISIVPSTVLADMDVAGDVQRFDAPYLGPGLQVTATRSGTLDGEPAELAQVHLVFDDGEVAVMLSLDEMFAPLIALALPTLVLLCRNARVVRGDGEPVVGRVPAGVVVTDEWPDEETP